MAHQLAARSLAQHHAVPSSRVRSSCPFTCTAQRRAVVRCSGEPSGPTSLAATTVASLAAALVLASPALAVGIESIDLPGAPAQPAAFARMAGDAQAKLKEAEDSFQQSSTLKDLLAKSEANKAKNKKAIQDKYCYRQAELGVGDCGGLRYIPGLTENGKQETPQWLADLLGVEVPKQDVTGGKTLRDLIYADKEKAAE